MSDWTGPVVSLFDINTPEHSVYYVSSDMDLYLSVAALNAKRLSEDEQLDLVYILPDEFNLASIKPFQTDDAEAIYCYQARKLHHGIITDNHNEKDKIHSLVKKLKDADRKPIRIRSKQALRIIEHLRPSGCHSYKLNRESNPPILCKPCGEPKATIVDLSVSLLPKPDIDSIAKPTLPNTSFMEGAATALRSLWEFLLHVFRRIISLFQSGRNND